MTDPTGGNPLSLASAALAMARRERVTEPLGPTPLIAVPDLAELIAAAEECAGKLEASMGEAPDRVAYPHYHHSYECDTDMIRRLRAAVARVRGE